MLHYGFVGKELTRNKQFATNGLKWVEKVKRGDMSVKGHKKKLLYG